MQHSFSANYDIQFNATAAHIFKFIITIMAGRTRDHGDTYFLMNMF